MSATKHEGRPTRTANATGTTTKHHSTAVTDNRRNVCIDCDSPRLARGYHRCQSCLLDLCDALQRRRDADLRLAVWHAPSRTGATS